MITKSHTTQPIGESATIVNQSTETPATSQSGVVNPILTLLNNASRLTQPAFVPNPSITANVRTNDAWDTRQIGDMMELNENQVTFSGGHGRSAERGNSAFLTNIVDHGVHRWTFKVNLRFCHWWASTIGIWKCSDQSTPPRNDIFTLIGEGRAYGFNLSEGTLVDPITGKVHIPSPVQYGQRCIGVKVVEMVLDLDQLELKYIINGRDYGKAFSVEEGAYRAAVNLSRIGDSVEVM